MKWSRTVRNAKRMRKSASDERDLTTRASVLSCLNWEHGGAPRQREPPKTNNSRQINCNDYHRKPLGKNWKGKGLARGSQNSSPWAVDMNIGLPTLNFCMLQCSCTHMDCWCLGNASKHGRSSFPYSYVRFLCVKLRVLVLLFLKIFDTAKNRPLRVDPLRGIAGCADVSDIDENAPVKMINRWSCHTRRLNTSDRLWYHVFVIAFLTSAGQHASMKTRTLYRGYWNLPPTRR